MARTIALVTAHEARALDEDLPPLVAALRALGAEVDTPSWDDPAIDWSRYDASVIRSTWDYADRVDEFLDWAERADARTRLYNPPAVLRWNTDKHYLRDLANDFHTYYNAHVFIVDDAALRDARLALISATRQVIANGLGILGVSAPEQM